MAWSYIVSQTMNGYMNTLSRCTSKKSVVILSSLSIFTFIWYLVLELPHVKFPQTEGASYTPEVPST